MRHCKYKGFAKCGVRSAKSEVHAMRVGCGLCDVRCTMCEMRSANFAVFITPFRASPYNIKSNEAGECQSTSNAYPISYTSSERIQQAFPTFQTRRLKHRGNTTPSPWQATYTATTQARWPRYSSYSFSESQPSGMPLSCFAVERGTSPCLLLAVVVSLPR